MRKKLLITLSSVLILTLIYILAFNKNEDKETWVGQLTKDFPVKKKKKTQEERALFAEERAKYEFNLQKNPITGEIPVEEKKLEFESAMEAKEKVSFGRSTSRTYSSRGPGNLGGRTRALVIDITDATSNTILAGGVSSGLFRTTNGGASWTKVSPNDDIHNVTAIAQDPRSGFQNIWYYATGERSGNSATLGSAFRGQGVWKSVDSGVTWTRIAATNTGSFEAFDTSLDYISDLVVSPLNGDLMIAAFNDIFRYDGTTLTNELTSSSGGTGMTDVVVASTGRVYATFEGNTSNNGVWTSPTGNGSWTKITSPSGWDATGRIVLGIAPSNENVVYVLYENGDSGNIEADLWRYNLSTDTWTDFSSKLPDEAGGDLSGNDPFAIQGGYDIVVSVKPDDENFVVIGGTNVYRISNINSGSTFFRIGGYVSNQSYGLYSNGGDAHHPDIHALVFDPNDSGVLFSGTDGGVHKTTSVNGSVVWENLNNNYLTYQYYYVAMDPESGGNLVFGGAQDNGTTIGGTDAGGGITNATDMTLFSGGDGVAVGVARRNGGSDFQLYYGSQRGNMRTNYPNFRTIAPDDVDLDNGDGLFVTYFYLDPDNTETLYYVLDNVLYRTNDAENVTRSTWSNIGSVNTFENIRTLSATRGAYSTSDSHLLIGGDEGGIFRIDNPHNSFASIARLITPRSNNTDDGVGATTSSGTIVSGLAIHPTNPDIVLATYANYGITSIFLTTNATVSTPSWTVVERNLSSHSVRSAAIAEVDGQTIYFVGTARGLYSSNDPTTTDWAVEGANEIGLPVVSGLVYRPSDNKLLVGTHGNGMFETTVVANTLSTDEFANNDLGAFVYPNPVQSELNIRASKIDFNDNVTYQISDLSGKLIKNGAMIDRKVNVENLSKGLYIINLESKGLKGSLKFLKQ